jgi:hypothetical protein
MDYIVNEKDLIEKLEEKLKKYNPNATRSSQIKLGQEIFELREKIALMQNIQKPTAVESGINNALRSRYTEAVRGRNTLGQVWAIKKKDY